MMPVRRSVCCVAVHDPVYIFEETAVFFRFPLFPLYTAALFPHPFVRLSCGLHSAPGAYSIAQATIFVNIKIKEIAKLFLLFLLDRFIKKPWHRFIRRQGTYIV